MLILLLNCELYRISKKGKTFLFKSISCVGAFFYTSACPVGYRLFLCVKKQAHKDDYGKEFQQKVQGSLCRNSIAVLSMSSGLANFAQRKSLSTRQVCQCKGMATKQGEDGYRKKGNSHQSWRQWLFIVKNRSWNYYFSYSFKKNEYLCVPISN